MQPLKLIILSTVTFMQHSTSDNVAMFHVKHAASLLGLCDPDTRLPLVEIAEASKQKVEAAMRHAGLLN